MSSKLISSVRLYVIGFAGMVYVVLFKIKETNYTEESVAPEKGDKCHLEDIES